MNAVIVDTNVIVIANDTDDKREDCRDRCQDRLQQILDQGEKVIIDDRWRILGEYEDNVNPNARKKGIGDLFVKRHCCKILGIQRFAQWCQSPHWLEMAQILKSFQTTQH